ncbi:FAD/NAD(P)-binding domain-containing protein [Melanomma pulvis-pyrius CBS 109.77]|uniref:FAD/NAD(P)-binding domain-containing protein n=1 Tax=Melanomma pulvis-pyrius CBS 109.77 TaxID=1314802 RepID=A0A6A6XRM0_9PLEO|nr:FAD/NAD(P)-binding domain-containing protein [Melanomma pulvis-pyrius CBS 109.77]
MRLQDFGSLSLASPHRVLIVGCAYGGISALVNLRDLALGKARESVYTGPDFKGLKSKNGLEITVIDERDGYFHSVGAPLAHVTPKHTKLMWKRFSQLNELRHPNLHFKHGSVKKVDPETKIAEWVDKSGKTQFQSYDYVIMATGLRRHWPAVPKQGSYEDYLRDGHALIDRITGGDPTPKDRKVIIIGAGAVGIEFAGEIKNYYPSISVTLIHSRSEVLSSEPLPAEIKAQVKTLLKEEGVDVILENRASVEDLPNGKYEVTLANGTKLVADLVLDATKKGYPTTNSLPPQCLDDAREIMVNSQLAFKADIPNAESHFGVGDAIAWSGIKRAGGAMVMGQVAAQNIYASILNSEDAAHAITKSELSEWPAVIGIAVGKQCLTYDPKSGMKFGADVMKGYFQDDLGWAANLKYLDLTDVEEPREPSKGLEQVKIGDVGVEPVSSPA